VTILTSQLGGAPAAHAFEEIFRLYAQFVYRTAYGVTRSHEDAEDILQTVFLRLVRREIPPALRENPKAYLYRSAVNLSLDALQSRRRQVLVDTAELYEIPAPVTESIDYPNHGPLAEDQHRRLYQAIGQLKPTAAEIVILRYLHNMSDAEIAAMLGVSRGTIALRLFRSRARLKKILNARLGGRS